MFVSSTFHDMQAERDWLNRMVLPRIEEELAKRRQHLEPVDLRIGVEDSFSETREQRELSVLKVCLDEIRRSRPFLIVLLGDRYGWVPPPERIDAAAREQGFEIDPVGKSVTAVEIEYGIFRDHPDQKRRCLFFFRRALPYDAMPAEMRALFSDAESPDPATCAGHRKLVSLRITAVWETSCVSQEIWKEPWRNTVRHWSCWRVWRGRSPISAMRERCGTFS